MEEKGEKSGEKKSDGREQRSTQKESALWVEPHSENQTDEIKTPLGLELKKMMRMSPKV